MEAKLPPIILGTAFFQDIDYSLFLSNALKAGFKHIDTANRYYNEKNIGKALLDNKVNREDIIITSKLWPSDYKKEKLYKAFDGTLKRLNISYIDYFLLHKSINNYIEAYKCLMELRDKKLIKHIGVSNFNSKQLEKIKQECGEYPEVNQIEVNCFYYDLDTIEFCHKHNIIVEGYSPISNKKFKELELIESLSQKYQKSKTQILLRFVYQLGVIPVVKSKNYDHLVANNNIWDFEIEIDDFNKIKSLKRKDLRIMKKVLDFFGDRISINPDNEKV